MTAKRKDIEHLQQRIMLLEQQLEKSKTQNNSTQNQHTDIGDLVLFSLDRNYCYISFNQRHFQTMKTIWNKEIEQGLSMLDFIGFNEDKQKAKNNFDKALAGESFVLIEEYGDITYSRIYYENTYQPLVDSHGEIYGLTVYVKDITVLKQAERELKTQNEFLQFAKKQAEKSNKLKTDFLQNLSHEIRTPLNAIMGFSTFLTEMSLPKSKKKQFSDIIINSGNQLIKVIENILEIAALENKNVTLSKSNFKINQLILDVFMVFQPMAQERKIRLFVSPQLVDLEIRIYTDKAKLRKILANLIENAIKFTVEGCIEIGYKIADNNIDFYILDSGVGIEESMQSEIFDLFSQKSSQLNYIHEGLGLGLCIVKENVELLNGQLKLDSKIGEGTSVYISFPGVLNVPMTE